MEPTCMWCASRIDTAFTKQFGILVQVLIFLLACYGARRTARHIQPGILSRVDSVCLGVRRRNPPSSKRQCPLHKIADETLVLTTGRRVILLPSLWCTRSADLWGRSVEVNRNTNAVVVASMRMGAFTTGLLILTASVFQLRLISLAVHWEDRHLLTLMLSLATGYRLKRTQ